MKTIAWLGVLGAAMTLTGCEGYYGSPRPGAPVGYAAPASAVAPACFYTKDIRNHTVGDDHTLYLNVANRRFYRVGMSGSCLAGATSSDPIVIQNPPGANDVCRPIDLDVGVTMGGFINHCIVRSITPMSPAEVAALPSRLRP
jgi:hypothetical protein